MFKAKIVISVCIVILLMILKNSYSQENAITGSTEQTIYQTGKDQNPQTGIFKLYGSKQTQFENTTILKFELGEEAYVMLTVCDSKGKIIDTLIYDLMDAGVYNVHYKSVDKIIAGELTYKLEVKGISGVKNVFAVK